MKQPALTLTELLTQITPLPYVVAGELRETQFAALGLDSLNTDTGHGLCDFVSSRSPTEIAADARYLAHAANHFPLVVAALFNARNMLLQLGMKTDGNPIHPDDPEIFGCRSWREHAEQIRTALGRAEHLPATD